MASILSAIQDRGIGKSEVETVDLNDHRKSMITLDVWRGRCGASPVTENLDHDLADLFVSMHINQIA